MKTEQGTVFFITAIFKIFSVATASILEAFLQLFLLLVNITSSFLSVNQRFQSLYSNFCFLSFLFIFFCKTFFLRKYELKFGLLWIKIKPRDKPCVFSHFFYRFSRNSIIHKLKTSFSESFINSMSFSQYLSMFQCLF